jgi:hypothetical protein
MYGRRAALAGRDGAECYFYGLLNGAMYQLASEVRGRRECLENVTKSGGVGRDDGMTLGGYTLFAFVLFYDSHPIDAWMLSLRCITL